MKFTIIGSGGVGGFFGAKLVKSGEDVWFIARGPHLDAMKRVGLQINSTEGNFRVPPGKMTDKLVESGPSDVILFCVKSYDTELAARQLEPILTTESTIISLQNGVNNEEKIQKNIKTGAVYGGVANIYSTITEPGVITETGGPKKIEFGPLRPQHAVDEKRSSMRFSKLELELNSRMMSTPRSGRSSSSLLRWQALLLLPDSPSARSLL
jgi:2-dehydropantoate 2-reductase